MTDLHTLIIPKRHCGSYFDLSQAELNAINQLLKALKKQILKQDSTIRGFNIGVNDGDVSGQKIEHSHIHLIPRREGDVENPIGGFINVIQGKSDYKN